MDNRESMLEDRISALWNVMLSLIASLWAYFQPVHHLLEALLVVMVLNLMARIAQSIRGWKIRRSRKRRFSVWKWLGEIKLGDILMEFALASVIVMSLCVIYKILYPMEEEAVGIFTVTKYGVYFMLIAYFILFLVRVGEAFPNNYLVKVLSLFFKKFNVLKLFNFSKDLSEDTMRDLSDIAKTHAKK